MQIVKCNESGLAKSTAFQLSTNLLAHLYLLFSVLHHSNKCRDLYHYHSLFGSHLNVAFTFFIIGAWEQGTMTNRKMRPLHFTLIPI